MLEFENTIRIDRPIGEVFAFLSDLENVPKWNYYVVEVTKLSNGPIGIGTIYHQVRKRETQRAFEMNGGSIQDGLHRLNGWGREESNQPWPRISQNLRNF